MKRLEFALVSCGVIVAGAAGIAAGQVTLDLVPQLVEVREHAENDLRQVHLLAKYTSEGSSAPPINLALIDSQYDDLVAEVNGYISGLATAVALPRPLDDKQWQEKGSEVIAHAQGFDTSMQQLRAQNGGQNTATARGVSLLTTVGSILGQIILPGSTLFQNTKKLSDAASLEQKHEIADVLKTAAWRSSSVVLAPPSAPRSETSPSPERSPAPTVSPTV